MNRSSIHKSIRHEGGVSRRLFLAYATTLSSIPFIGCSTLARHNPRFSSYPFSLGIASGDPNSNSVVLWTRLAPKPLDPDGGMPPEPIAVKWQVAEDEAMGKVVASGTEIATPQLGHSVHVEVNKLKPDRWYWYRFTAGNEESAIARTRTLPEADSKPDRLTFAFASCQSLEQGYYTAYERMAQDQLDLVFHLGDYIYEYKSGNQGQVRLHHGKEIESLAEYRVRYAQYKSDQLLQNMHLRCPWFVTWDDHEFDNNYANDISELKGTVPADFLIRRANAYQAFYENMPLRRTSVPTGPNLQLYRKTSFGQLAEFMVLDGRQYRSNQPNNEQRS